MMNREQQPYLRKAAANGRSSEVARRRGEGVIGPRSAPAQLPAPNGPIYIVLRMYWPEASVLNGSWQPPSTQAAQR